MRTMRPKPEGKNRKVRVWVILDTFYFNSKVERFLSQKSELATGPGAYELNKSGFVKETFNRTNEGYVGDKSQRFDDVLVRPNIVPGTYYWVTFNFSYFRFQIYYLSYQLNLLF